MYIFFILVWLLCSTKTILNNGLLYDGLVRWFAWYHTYLFHQSIGLRFVFVFTNFSCYRAKIFCKSQVYACPSGYLQLYVCLLYAYLPYIFSIFFFFFFWFFILTYPCYCVIFLFFFFDCFNLRAKVFNKIL